MKVELNVSAASKIVTMSNCPRGDQHFCGVNYRSF